MPATTALVVAGAASAAAGAIGSAKTRKANKNQLKDARLDERNRRERAAGEMEKAIEAYNKIREERPDFTVQEFLSERANELGGEEAKQLTEQIRAMKAEDVQAAQSVADAATTGNINTFDVALDAISGGDSAKILAERNQNALQTNETDALSRALELRSTNIPAGTVRQDSEGRFVEGQRADKQQFQLAFETKEAIRDKQFSKINTILENDRAVAQRQQEKALDFLNQQDTTGFVNALAGQSRAERIGFQKADEVSQLQNIQNFQNAAFQDKTRTPQLQSTASSDALVKGGFDIAIKGLSKAGNSTGNNTGS